MKLERLLVRNFRNIKESSFAPSSSINFFIGSNGQGKTSFLEAIGFLASLRSFRGSKSEEVVRWDQPTGEILGRLTDSSLGTADLKICFEKQTDELGKLKFSKTAFINEKPYKSSTHYLSQRFHQVQLGFHAVSFNPSDHDLVQGEPILRRGYLDRSVAAEDIEHLKTARKYQRVLEQRNALLKNDHRPDRAQWMSFTEPLVELGSLLALSRLKWIERLNGRLNNAVQKIAPAQAPLWALYQSNWAPKYSGLSFENNKLSSVHFSGQQDQPSLQTLEHAFWQKLSLLESKEFDSGTTLVGPHRDDWALLLGERALKGHGSQGEIRSALLSLKLCEIELFLECTGLLPIFLLDDFSSELDRDRRRFLLSYLLESDLQVFVSTTEDLPADLESLQKAAKKHQVSQGNLAEMG